MTAVRPILVLAVGNPSRGDDALGPELAVRLAATEPTDVEVIEAFQLQVENALDLVGRERVIIIDAGTGTRAPFELRRVEAAPDFLHTSHALPPEAVLSTCLRVTGTMPPEAWLLCVRGESFELGAPLSAEAGRHLDAAWTQLARLCELDPGATRPVPTD